MGRNTVAAGLILCVTLIMPPTIARAQYAPTVDISMIHEAHHAMEKGVDFLRSTRMDDGSWSSYPAITALVVTALLRCPDNVVDPGDPMIERGCAFVVSNVQPDGGIYTQDPMRSYNTAICLMALVESANPVYHDIITRAREYLIMQQADERVGYDTVDSLYGGFGYGGDERPDLSNLQVAIETLAESESYEDISEADLKTVGGVDHKTGRRPYYEKAVIFLTRCQNLKSTNPYNFATNDGGFMYYPGNSKAGDTSSYASMTYAGLKSFIYANVDRDDERVKAAYGWITRNYSVTENPGIGSDGLFYYYHTMSKALNIYGTDFIVTVDGVRYNWREDLIRQLATIQKDDGSWANDNARWWESNKDLVTAYAILSLLNAGWPAGD